MLSSEEEKQNGHVAKLSESPFHGDGTYGCCWLAVVASCVCSKIGETRCVCYHLFHSVFALSFEIENVHRADPGFNGRQTPLGASQTLVMGF